MDAGNRLHPSSFSQKATISHLNDEISISKGKLRDLASKREHLQKLMGARGRAKEIQEAEKQLTEFERQASMERRGIYDAHRVVTEAVRNLEAMNLKAWSISKKFPEVRFVTFDIGKDAIRKFSGHDAVPASWQ